MTNFAELKVLLRSHVAEGEYYTHVSMVRPLLRKFVFNPHDLELFWDSYCSCVFVQEGILGIAEKSHDTLPILVDVDLKVKLTPSSETIELYTEKQAESLIGIYQKILREIVRDITDENLICVLLTKLPYQNDVYLKHGFHLHFPYLFMLKEEQKQYLIPKVKEELKRNNLFGENSDKVIDDAILRVPWLLYGSCKNNASKPYLVSGFYDSEGKKIGKKEALLNYQIFDDKEHLIPIKGKIRYYYPRILSVIPHGRPYIKEVKKSLTIPIVTTNESNRVHKPDLSEEMISKNLMTAKHLMKMLNSSRAEEYQSWMSVFWCLFNISDGHHDALQLWKEFSSLSDKYDGGNECDRLWEKHTKKMGYNLGSLRNWAKDDNPQDYQKYKEEERSRYYPSLFLCTDKAIGQVIHEEFQDQIVTIEESKGSIYGYVYNQSTKLWEKMTHISLGNYFIPFLEDLIQECLSVLSEKSQEYRNSEDDHKADQTIIMVRIKEINKFKSKLGDQTFRNKIPFGIHYYSCDREFEKKLNSMRDLLPVRGGKIVDLTTGEIRDRNLEDYFTYESCVYPSTDLTFGNWFLTELCAKKDFQIIKKEEAEEYNDKDEEDEIEEKHDIVLDEDSCAEEELEEKRQQNDRDQRDQIDKIQYLKEVGLYSISGHTFARRFWQFNGRGNNGKTSWIQILRAILGEESVVSPDKALVIDIHGSIKASAGQARADIFNLANKRLITVSETDKGNTINSFAKLLADNSLTKIEVRTLNSKIYCKIPPIGKLLIDSNFALEPTNGDPAIRKRNICVNLENRFVENEQFIEDIINNRDGKLDSIFGAILEGGKNALKNRKLFHPKCVLRSSNELFESCDDIQKFLNEHVEEDKKEYVTSRDMFNRYVSYCLSQKIPSEKERHLFHLLKNKGYVVTSWNIGPKRDRKHLRGYRGIKLKVSE